MTDLPAGDDETRGPLRRRDFAIYWWAGIVSSPGNWASNVCASVLMLSLTGSPFMVGVVNFAIFIPNLLFSLPAGALGDRVERRRMVVVTQSVALATAVVMAVLSGTGALTPLLLVATCFVLGTANAFTKPPMLALIALLVPRPMVARATALNVVQFQFGQIAGPGIASVILLTATPTWAFAINAVSCLGPIVAMLLIRLGSAADRGSVKKAGSGGVVEGLRFVARTPLMPAILLAVVLTNAAVEALRTLAPTLSAELDLPDAAGVVIMGNSIGAMLGLVTFGLIEKVLPRRWMLTTAFALQALGAAVVAVGGSLPVLALGALPIGIGFSLSIPLLSASLQMLSPDNFRSRVMAVFSMAHLGLRPLFALAAGALASVFGGAWSLAVFAVAAAAVAVVIRRLHVDTAD
ncbi:MFS transporter [Jiangella ureilytica]|uniref:MFS transporter n=1 Tax=Jiangella ureilytica TaxID=2530374 RepID=A0A4R4RDG6_9ACTN|nr:MFS transporter [Jiangella ureilytica]TDC47237.1 MFS transporter [Jiangella ureilytica]